MECIIYVNDCLFEGMFLGFSSIVGFVNYMYFFGGLMLFIGINIFIIDCLFFSVEFGFFIFYYIGIISYIMENGDCFDVNILEFMLFDGCLINDLVIFYWF